jgi:hypothetical protein
MHGKGPSTSKRIGEKLANIPWWDTKGQLDERDQRPGAEIVDLERLDRAPITWQRKSRLDAE